MSDADVWTFEFLCRVRERQGRDEQAQLMREVYEASRRSHEPPRNSGEADTVNGLTALAGGDDAHEPT